MTTYCRAILVADAESGSSSANHAGPQAHALLVRDESCSIYHLIVMAGCPVAPRNSTAHGSPPPKDADDKVVEDAHFQVVQWQRTTRSYHRPQSLRIMAS
jgi:hypothetical protein